ncbi:hypothetical protein CoNPh23_CDS0057 [Staphylococcus phage S-CoN_Ph23]|nr:hypothetical protein CoNPh23_CDS0057 [Staphylococcus phage S-CoN_Ph23]
MSYSGKYSFLISNASPNLKSETPFILSATVWYLTSNKSAKSTRDTFSLF